MVGYTDGRNKIKHILEEDETKWGRVVTLIIQWLILISLVTFALETLPSLSPSAERWLHGIEIVIVILFTIEYVLRLWVADRKLGFIFSFYGLIDLIAILPFYISLGVDLRSLRSLRLLRLFRILKLVRYSRAMQRFYIAFQIAKEEVILFFFVTLLLLYLSAIGIYYFENTAQPHAFTSVFDGLWWAVASLTSVGYGDVYPITIGGKIFTSIVLLIGIGMVSIPSGLIASAFARARTWDEDKQAQERTDHEGDDGKP